MRKQDKVAYDKYCDEMWEQTIREYNEYLLKGEFREYSPEDETISEYKAERAEFMKEREAFINNQKGE